MKIIADENIPYVMEAFSTLGELELRPGREIVAADVQDAELLLVRSVTNVNETLLQGSTVRFVATATIGEDHIDRAYLAEHGIVFSSAPGCNANSVGEYIVAALLHLGERYNFSLAGKSLGIVGVGNVGSNVAQKATALGMEVVLNDPPLQEATQDSKYRSIEEIIGCDIITTHVPLTKSGQHKTVHLIDEAFLAKLKQGAFVINTARGSVVDNLALLRALEREKLMGAVLDVWEGEPDVNLALLDAVDLASPHIAGYSFDGKVKGTLQIYQAAAAFLGQEPLWTPASLLPEAEHPDFTADSSSGFLKAVVDTVYPIVEDDERMRKIAFEAATNRRSYFDQLRKAYPRRREFFNTEIKGVGADDALRNVLAGIGFTIR